jgi:hypothetical protein
MGKKYFGTKENTLESSILSVWTEAAKKEELSTKQKKLDVDGDGEIEGSDLAKLRKKGAKKEGNAFGMALKAAKDKGEKTFVVSGKTYEVKEAVEVEESYEIGTNEYRDHALNVTPGETDPEWVQARDFKISSMKAALAKVWGLDEKALDKTSKEGYDEEDDELKPVSGSKTMTGGKIAKVDTKPKTG